MDITTTTTFTFLLFYFFTFKAIVQHEVLHFLL